MTEIEHKVSEHGERIIKLETILEGIGSDIHALNVTSQQMADTMQSIQLTLAQLANNDSNNIKAFDRIHARIDSNVEKIAKQNKINENKFKELDPVFFVMRYPKIAMLIAASTYLLTIKEVRDVVFAFFKLV